MTPYRPGRDLVPSKRRQEKEPRDLMAKEGAEQLARELNDWWHSRGYPQVHHWIESKHVAPGRSHSLTWCVRSNLVNGMPPPPARVRSTPRWVGSRVYRADRAQQEAAQ